MFIIVKMSILRSEDVFYVFFLLTAFTTCVHEYKLVHTRLSCYVLIYFINILSYFISVLSCFYEYFGDINFHIFVNRSTMVSLAFGGCSVRHLRYLFMF